MEEIELTVAEERQRDAGRGIARVNQKTMKKLGIKVGDVIEIAGNKKTVAIAWPCYKEDENKDIIRIDNFTRKNAGLPLDGHALVRTVEVKNARKIILAPVDLRLSVDEDFENFVKNRLMERVFSEGDIIVVKMLEHVIPFSVVRATPREIPVRVSSDTGLSILNEPFRHPEHKLETPTDLRYLLRFDWLKSLAARIKTTKTVFVIPDHEISDENEQKVIEKAQEIAYEDFSNVHVQVSVQSDGKTIGTFPWVEIDIYGRISAIYPDIPLPPMPPAFGPQGTRGRAVPPMKRCFKTGVNRCPKEITFSPKSVVVAMPFRDDFKDAYIYAIRPALEESGFKPWKADEQISNIDIMCKICQAIQESGYVLANITMWNPNVVFELGLAYGLARNVILIKHKKAEVPVDLRGLEYIEYSTIDELKRNLVLFLKGAATTE